MGRYDLVHDRRWSLPGNETDHCHNEFKLRTDRKQVARQDSIAVISGENYKVKRHRSSGKEGGSDMTVNRSYSFYREQYQRHLDELTSFLEGMLWDVDRISLSVRGNIITIKRTDTGKRLKLHYKQLAGLLRYATVKGQAWKGL